MARTVLPIVGAVVGAYFGNPYAGYAIGAAIAGVVDPINTKGPRIGETGAQTSQEGAPRAIVYGTCQVTGNVIASGPLIKRDVKESQGKGGGTTSTEHAYRTFAVRICEGPIADVLRIWEDDKLVYDIRPASTMLQESAKWGQGMLLYKGNETQLPDPSLQMIFGIDEVPAHRGSAYIVFTEKDLTDRRGSIPQFRFEVASAGSTRQVREPLVINPWSPGVGPPMQSSGSMEFRGGLSSTTWSDYDTAVAANAIEYQTLYTSMSDFVRATAKDSKTYIGFKSSTNATINMLPGGASLADNPATLTYQLAYEIPVEYLTEVTTCVDFNAWMDVSPRYTEGVNGYNPAVVIAEPDPFLTIPGYRSGVSCGLEYGYINYVAELRATREAAPAEDLIAPVIVFAVAKQLCNIAYRDGALYQNALGPVLLPSDPNYNNETWWQDQRDAAIAAGTLASDVAFAVTVNAYVDAYRTGRGEPMPLSEIVSDIHSRCNFPSGQFDVSELTDMVSGLVLAGEYTGADAINTLRSLYLFDAADQDRSIVYPKRGKAVVATITENDIVEAEQSSRREQAIEYPKKLHLSYQNAVGGYAIAKATSARSSPDVRVVGEVSTAVPVVLSPNQAARTAAIMHKIAWAEAEGETKLSVPLSWIKYIASDCFGVALRGKVTRERLDELNYADGVVEYTLRRDRQSAYTSQVTGIPIPEPTPPPSTIVGETVLAVIDISGRVDSEDDLNILYAVTGGLPAWSGATVQRSLDGGANFSNIVDIGRGIVMGVLLTGLADADESFDDATNVLRVQLYRDTLTLEDIGETQFLSEGGAFVIMRPDGSSEVMQYMNATEVSTGVYDLSMLHRGLLNSGTSAHLAGAVFVGLSRAVHATAQSTWIGADLTHRAVSFGESPETADEQTQTYVGRSQIEWEVAYLTPARDGSDNVSATWEPRHRFGSDLSPVASTNFRGYRVTLDDGVLPAVTFDTTAQSFTYDASALSAPLTVSVAALNRITGAGPSVSESI